MRKSNSWFWVSAKGLFLSVLLSLIATAAAVRQTHLWLTNRQPLRMSLSQFLAQRPSGEWLELSDVNLRYDQAVVLVNERTQNITAIYVPAWPSSDTSKPVHLVLDATRTRKDEASPGKFPSSTITTIRGVRRPQILAGNVHPAQAGLTWQCASDCIELIDGDQPSEESAFIFIAVAAGLWAFTAWCIIDFRRRDSTGRIVTPASGKMLDGSYLD